MRKTFFISDLHFGHRNIIKYENRPFESIEDMDKVIFNNWNEVVSKEDLVFVLGDVSLHRRDITIQLVQGLIGQKVLILGNHDKSRSLDFWREAGFSEVYKYPIIFKKFYILSHEPVYLNSNMPYMNIHGHIHSKRIQDSTGEIKQFFNVSVECINYKPIDFEVIKVTVISDLEDQQEK